MADVEKRSTWSRRDNGATVRSTPLKEYQGYAVHWPAATWSLTADDPHTDCRQRLRGVENEQMNRKPPATVYAAVAYQVVACPHGRLMEGRTVRRVNGANGDGDGDNTDFGSCLALLGPKDRPTAAMLRAILSAGDYLNAKQKLVPHSFFHATQCPGPDLTQWLADGAPDPGDDDMPLTDEDVTRIANAVWTHRLDNLVSGTPTKAGRLVAANHKQGSETLVLVRNPSELARDVAALLPAGQVVTVDMLSAALARTLGQLDDAAADAPDQPAGPA